MDRSGAGQTENALLQTTRPLTKQRPHPDSNAIAKGFPKS